MINILDYTPNQPPNFTKRTRLKQMMNDTERKTLTVKLSLKIQYESQVYAIIMMHTYILKER